MRSRAFLLFVVALFAAAASLAAAPRAGSTPVEWQAGALDLPLAWQVTTGGPASVVAVVDSGVQADHPALQGRVLPGYDFVHGDTNANDDNGHGTAVAGIIASVCPGCRILPVKVLDEHRTGDWPTIAAGIVWAADHGAQVINLSVGGAHALDVVAAAVAQAVSKGVIVVAAAGNDGSDESFYPASYPGVISVAAVDQTGARSSFSNFGGGITVAAPGCATAPWLESGYTSDFCGTSTAAPFVAGLAGLARAFDPTLVPQAFLQALTDSASPLLDSSTASHGVPDANRLLVDLGAPSSAPVANTPPAVPVAPKAGRRLLARVGEWRGASSYRVEWQRFAGKAGWRTVVSGPAFTPRPADRGSRLRVLVTAANVRGSTTAVSAPSPFVTP
ncbi:MAG: S8 family serine peptidase [Gaiellaceae bacterium]